MKMPAQHTTDELANSETLSYNNIFGGLIKKYIPPLISWETIFRLVIELTLVTAWVLFVRGSI